MIGKICGTGSYLPDYIIDNFKLAESVDTSDEWIQERTGIRQRHIAKKETTSYMASMAALKALENAGTEPEEIDMWQLPHQKRFIHVRHVKSKK